MGVLILLVAVILDNNPPLWLVAGLPRDWLAFLVDNCVLERFIAIVVLADHTRDTFHNLALIPLKCAIWRRSAI